MSWIDRLRMSPETMHGIFSPWQHASSSATHSGVLASYQGPMREQVLALVERAGAVPEGTTEAARAGASGAQIGREVRDVVSAGAWSPTTREAGRRTLGMAASIEPSVAASLSAAADPLLEAAIRSNPIFGGVMGQLLAQRGLLPTIIAPQQATALGHAAGATIADVAHVATASHASSVVADAAAGVGRLVSRADRIARFDDALAAALKLVRL